MHGSAAPGLSRIGFRRDVRLFFSILVGFLAALILLLIVFLHRTYETARESMWSRENDLARVAATEIPEIVRRGGDIEAELVAIRSRYGFEAVELRFPGGRVATAGFTEGLESVGRKVGAIDARFYFDPAPYESLRRRVLLTAGVSIVATALGIAMLFLYLPRMLRPIEEMLDHARELGERREGVDETVYLIETFRHSIETLKKQETELKSLHEREKRRADDLQTITSTLTRSLTSGFVALDPEGRLVDVNGSAREILSLTQDDVTGWGVADVAGDSDFSRVLADAATARVPVSRREVALGDKVIGLTIVPLFDAAEKFLGTLALFTDLTQVRRLESRVRDLQTLADLGVMSAGIAHEFRNSLSTILGLLKLAERTQPSPEVSAKLKAAEAEANELADAVTSLLHFARPMQVQLADAPLREILGSAVARLHEAAPEVTFAIDGGEVVVQGDVVLLSRAFENIIRNAIDAVSANVSADSGLREVRITIEGGVEPRVTVADSGSGIAPGDAANLFLPFFSTKPGGVGLGLPLARKILLLHGASIRIDSRPEGGTRVTIDFLDQAETESHGERASA